MKFTSSFALAIALLGGTAAVAAKKEAPAAAAGSYSYQLGKPFRAAAGPVQAALKAGDAAGAQTTLAALDAAATSPDEKYVAAQLRLQAAQLTKDPKQQEAAVNAMIASGSGAATPQLGQLNYYAGTFAYDAGNYPRAVQMLTAAEQAGNRSTDLYLRLAEANFKVNQFQPGFAAIDKAIAASQAAGTKAPEAWYARAASVAYKAKLNADATRWTRLQVAAYPTPENWRSALVIYRDAQQRDGQVLLDIYRLMRLTSAIDGERDYAEYALLANERGLPGEAKSVIDEGYANGKAPRTSKVLTDVYGTASAKIAADRASLAASERQAGGAANGRIAANTGDAYLAYGDNAKAIALYRTALQKGGVDADQVNLRLGIALARSGDKAGAKAAFDQVKGTRAEVASFWNLYLDQRA